LQVFLLLFLFVFAILTLWLPAYWPTTMFQVGIFALAAITVWRARRHPILFAWPLVPLTFAVLWGILQWSTGHTAYGFVTRLSILKWTTFLCVWTIGVKFFRDEKAARWYRSAMIWFAFGVAVLATLQLYTSAGAVFWLFPTAYSDNVMGPFLSRNDFAAFIEVVLPIALYRAVLDDRDATLYSAMAAAMYAAVIASTSRAGVVLATLEILLVPLLAWFQRGASGRVVRTAVLKLAGLVAVLTLIAGPDAVWQRLTASDPFAIRRELTVSSWHMATEHALIGTGLGTWATVYPQYAIIDVGARMNEAHNDWLQWAVEGGFPFGILTNTLLFWSVRPAFRWVWGIGVVMVFLHATFDYPFARSTLGSWPILILAMLVYFKKETAAASAKFAPAAAVSLSERN